MSGELQHILGNVAITPDTSDSWQANRAYTKNTWVYHIETNRNWTAKRDTFAGEEPGQSSAWLGGPGVFGVTNSVYQELVTMSGVWTSPHSGVYRIFVQGGGGAGGSAERSLGYLLQAVSTAHNGQRCSEVYLPIS